MADIGSLVVKLAAETADFREDLGKSALLLERHAESMRGSLEKVAEVAKTTFAIAIGVESVGALKELVAHTLETVAALQDLAEQTGASATALSGFAPVATISGVAMEQIGAGLTKLSKGLAGVDDETKGASQALQFLGIKAKDAGAKLEARAEPIYHPVWGKDADELTLAPFTQNSGHPPLIFTINTRIDVWHWRSILRCANVRFAHP